MKSLFRTLAALILAIGLISGSITLAAGEQGMDQAATEEATATAEVTETATATETAIATEAPTETATAEPTETATAEPTQAPDNEYIQRLVEAIIRILQEILAEASAS